MPYISKYDLKFVTFMTRKYRMYDKAFEFIDDYLLWLYYKYCKCDEDLYYKQLEKDIIEYSDFQTGKERDKRGKLIDGWDEDVKDCGIGIEETKNCE